MQDQLSTNDWPARICLSSFDHYAFTSELALSQYARIQQLDAQMTPTTTCEVLFRPESDALKFLPEGPYAGSDGTLSWVGIQHGGESKVGSLNLLDPTAKNNQSFELPGRPGFAFPTDLPHTYICGVERSLGLFNYQANDWKVLVSGVDSDVDNTIINDAVVCGDNLIFGCKELEFTTKKAGLYLYRGADSKLIQLRDDQICSNGKAVIFTNGAVTLIDIDTPSKTVTTATLDIAAGTLGQQSVVVDMTEGEIFPDGLLLTPDGNSVIIAFYDPADPEFGVARQYGIESGNVEHVWTCPGSPRVTCPQLVNIGGKVSLILTTAVEGMGSEQLARHPNAGCLFIGATSFDSVCDQPAFPVSS